MARIYLEVPYEEKDEAKRLGAEWDALANSWYITDERNINAFKRWLNGGNLRSKVNGYQKRDDLLAIFMYSSHPKYMVGFQVSLSLELRLV